MIKVLGVLFFFTCFCFSASAQIINPGSGGASLPAGNPNSFLIYRATGTTAVAVAPQTALAALEGQPPFYVANYGAKCDGLVLKAITGAVVSSNNFYGNTSGPLNLVGTIKGLYSANAGMPVASLTGCTATSPTGVGDAGTYTSGTAGLCSTVITPFGTANALANNGWVCNGFDATTPADLQTQIASTATTATISGTTLANDVINYSC